MSQVACSVPSQDGRSLRDEAVVLAGSTRFDATRFAGDWVTVACIGTCAERERYSAGSSGSVARQVNHGVKEYVSIGPRALREADGGDTLVVMWVDDGFRTAAVGDADGRWAAIIDRGRPSPDRTKAARDVLDFNGWDVGQLKEVTI